MPHIMTISIGPKTGGLIATLECTEPADASKSECRSPYPNSCSIVECFQWDSTYALEGYVGSDIELSKFNVDVIEAAEDIFEWEMAGPASPDSGSTEERTER